MVKVGRSPADFDRKKTSLFQPIHLVFRKIHIQFNEPQAQTLTKRKVFVQTSVLYKCRHSKLYHFGISPEKRMDGPHSVIRCISSANAV